MAEVVMAHKGGPEQTDSDEKSHVVPLSIRSIGLRKGNLTIHLCHMKLVKNLQTARAVERRDYCINPFFSQEPIRLIKQSFNFK
jgi:hypothetical protein